jgi:hypothetical protein
MSEVFAAIRDVRDVMIRRSDDLGEAAALVGKVLDDIAEMRLAAKSGIPIPLKPLEVLRAKLLDLQVRLTNLALEESRTAVALSRRADASQPDTIEMDVDELVRANTVGDLEEIIATLRLQLAAHDHCEPHCPICAEP